MTEQPVQPTIRWSRLARLALIAIVMTAVLVPFLLGAIPMWGILHAGCSGGATPTTYSLTTAQEVEIPSRERNVVWRGYWFAAQPPPTAEPSIAARAQSVIIVPAAMGGDRGGMLYEAHYLVKAGFNVLTIESVVCARGGVHTLGYREAEQIEDAIQFLQTTLLKKANTSTTLPIALHGFSSAGASAIFAAARNPQINAVLAEGNYSDLNVNLTTTQSASPLEALLTFGGRSAYRLATGYDVQVLRPIEAIKQIPPRPLFLIYGGLEVERGGGRLLLDEAQRMMPSAVSTANADARFPRLWVIPNVEHGAYVAERGGSADYPTKVIAFYDCSLLQQCAAWDALWTGS